MVVSQSRLTEYLELLDEINRLAQDDLVALWQAFDPRDRDAFQRALRDGVPEIVAMYRSLAADTAMVFYEETQDVAFSREDALAASEVNLDQLDGNLRWALNSPGNVEVLGLLGGILQRHVVGGSRQYAQDSFARMGTGWYRAARPGACSFCRMLATRGATEWGPYTSANSAFYVGRGPHSRPSGSQPVGGTYHANCMCIPVRADSYEIPSYVEDWAETYYKATNEVGNAFDYRSILAQMREIDGIAH